MHTEIFTIILHTEFKFLSRNKTTNNNISTFTTPVHFSPHDNTFPSPHVRKTNFYTLHNLHNTYKTLKTIRGIEGTVRKTEEKKDIMISKNTYIKLREKKKM